MSKRIFLILGMHRSGTSALASVFEKGGLSIGRSIMAPSADNPIGYFENSRIERIHEELLNDFGLAWNRPAPLPDNWLETEQAEDAINKLASLLAEEFEPGTGILCKDPRLCVLAPLWSRLASEHDFELRYAAIIRNPEEVTMSLHARDKTKHSWAAQLYRDYNVSMYKILGSREGVLWTTYHHLIGKPEHCRQMIENIFPGEPPQFRESADPENDSSVTEVLYRNRRAGTSTTKLGLEFDRFFPVGKPITSENLDQWFQILSKASIVDFEEFETLDLNSEESASKLLKKIDELTKSNNSIEEKIEQIAAKQKNVDDLDFSVKNLEDGLRSAEEHITELEFGLGSTKSGINTLLDHAIPTMEASIDRHSKETAIKLHQIATSLKSHERAPFASNAFLSLYSAKKFLWGSLKAIYRILPLSRSLRQRVSEIIIPRIIRLSPDFGTTDNPVAMIDSVESEIGSGDIHFPEVGDPEISVILPVFNQLAHTLMCLKSLAEQKTDYSFEVIVMDDCSTDGTQATIAQIPNVRYVRNAKNLRFIENCNRGAEFAKGRFLVFLNNDTFLLPGWLQALRKTYDEHGDVGIVGSKLLFADGKLQEAGGIIWDDGTGWNWGRGKDPGHPRYCFTRDVDYVSGCSLMIERKLFIETGSFDRQLENAYYEDTSKSFQLREMGRRTIYQPRSQLIHYEGVSNGKDLSEGLKKYQVANRETFFQKYRNVLASHGANGSDPERASDRYVRGHILIVDATTPTPDRDSGSLDMINLIRIMIGLGYRVHFIPQTNFANFGEYTRQLQSMGVECVYAPYYTTVEDYLKEAGASLDFVFLARMQVAEASMAAVKKYAPNAAHIFYTVDLHYLRESREAEVKKDARLMKLANKHRKTEMGLIDQSDIALVLSDSELQILNSEGHGNIRKLPLLRQLSARQNNGYANRSGVVFIGGFQHTPNTDAVDWLVSDIWPIVRNIRNQANLPPIELKIVGSNMPKKYTRIRAEDINPIGYVSDLGDVFGGSRLSIAPLRFGAGLKGKLATSYEYGVPAVGTTIAFEGMPSDGLEEIMLFADSREDIARLVVDIYEDEQRWNSISTACFDYVKDHYSLETLSPVVEQILLDAEDRRNTRLQKLAS